MWYLLKVESGKWKMEMRTYTYYYQYFIARKFNSYFVVLMVNALQKVLQSTIPLSNFHRRIELYYTIKLAIIKGLFLNYL